MVEHYRLKGKLNQTHIRQAWSRLMGPTIAGYTKELKLRNKKLFITLDSAPLRQELSMGREKIKKILNDELGEAYIDEIVIR